MHKSLDQALSYSNWWLDLIKNPVVTEEQGKQIIEESTSNFAEHFNRGWLDYRKSVTEAGDWAATEWTGAAIGIPLAASQGPSQGNLRIMTRPQRIKT